MIKKVIILLEHVTSQQKVTQLRVQLLRQD